VDECRAAHPSCRIELDTNGDLHGDWDPDRVAQVVTNLTSNAIKHGGSVGTISFSLEGASDSVLMRVHNWGTPIPAAVIDHLFEPFKRGSESEGLGLGLYIVQQIVRAHGGAITVDSSENAGTTFTILWPRHAIVRTDRAA
jgi:phosphoserine phosphatase RsbU/P